MPNTTRSSIKPLVEGYQQFKQQHYEKTKAYEDLVQYGQQPKVLVLACCDSRVDPAIVTNSKPGELFVVRNVANLVPPYDDNPHHHGTSAALEFGVKGLNVTDIIVFGHSHCGGVRALMEAKENTHGTDFIEAWMDIAKSAREQVVKQHPNCSLDEKAHYCEKASLQVSLNNLLSFPWINERVQARRLFLHGWYFDLASGMIESYEPEHHKFEALV